MILAILLVACGEQPIETNTNGLKNQQEQIVDSHSEAATTSKGNLRSKQPKKRRPPNHLRNQKTKNRQIVTRYLN